MVITRHSTSLLLLAGWVPQLLLLLLYGCLRFPRTQ